MRVVFYMSHSNMTLVNILVKEKSFSQKPKITCKDDARYLLIFNKLVKFPTVLFVSIDTINNPTNFIRFFHILSSYNTVHANQ